ncbi:MAG TPA: protein kinase [Noviherbaspirillum sp.]
MKNEDNAKTMVRTRRMPFRPAPGVDPEQSVNVLPVGTHLGEFEILDLIGEGGFGIVYLAYDHSLERHVALKEYMPSGLATRTTSMAVTVRSQHNAATFTAGLKSFINEARMLAQFDSPSLVKVHRFWEGNGTAYMVMPFYEGITLKQALKERRITPSESWIRLLLADLFDAIETIHQAHCLHRDIAPDNILLLKDGRPLLLDFGAARRVIGDLTQCLTVILKPGFAPIEQYADIAGLRQGEWTDIYALAAVVYYLITGKAPPPAVARMVHDELIPARKAGKGRYSDAFLAALDKALSVKPEQRFRSIDELRRALDIMDTVPRTLPRDTGHVATTVVRPTVNPDPEPERQSPASPGARPFVRAEPRFGTVPRQKSEPVPEEEQEITQFLHAAPPLDQEWVRSTRPEPAQRSGRDKTEWMVLGLLLSAGIASGVYLGTRQSEEPGATPLIAQSSGDSATASSGASGMAEEETATRSVTPLPAPSMQAEEPPPATVAAPPPSPSPVVPESTARPEAPRPAQAGNQQDEIALWRQASGSDKASAYENYLREYPRGRYASLARIRLERKQPKVALAAPPMLPAPAEKRQKAVPAEVSTPAAPLKEPVSREAPPRKAPPQEKSEKAAQPVPSESTTREKVESPEEELWTTVTSINDGPAYEAYLYRYPRGKYAALARDRLEATPPKTAAPSPETAPQAAAHGTTSAGLMDKQASIRPSEPAAAPAPARRSAPAPEVTPPVRDSASQAAKKTIRAGNQTMTGDFTADPKNGIVSGTGRIVWSNGDQFEGTLVNGRKEGKGKFIWANGQRYTGDWANDAPNGKGVIVFTDGSRYEGDVKDGVPHGQGATRFKGGDVYRGAWVRGRSHGQGRYTWANGSYWEGEFRDDKRTENGQMVFAGSGDSPASGSSPTSAGEMQQAGTGRKSGD